MSTYIPPDGIPRVAPSDMDGKLAAFLRRRNQKRHALDRARQADLAIRAAQKLRHVRISGRKK